MNSKENQVFNLLLIKYTFSKKSTKSEVCNFIKKETLAQVLSCEFCEISKNTSGRLLLQDRKEKRLFLRKQGNTTKERHNIPGNYKNLYQDTVYNFARLLGVCPPDYNPERVNIPRKKANF